MGKIATTGYHNGCKITAADLIPPKSEGKSPQVAIDLQNAAGDYITYYGSLSQNALPYTVERLRNCGWTGDNLETLPSIVGRTVDIKVVENNYNGTTSLKVGSIYAEKPPKKRDTTDPATVKSIAAQYAARIAAIKPKDGPDSPEPPPFGNDDIPF